jgi:hypothetical protein
MKSFPLVLLFLAAIDALACTPVSSLPFAITAPGHYCLSGNVQSTGGGIQVSIAASDVTLDLSGFSLTCNAAQNGIFATTAQSNIRVQNGTVRGCNFAVSLGQCSACTVNAITAINNSGGIAVGGAGGRIADNTIRNDQSNAGNPAILLDGYSSVVRGNLVSGSNIGVMNRGKGNVIRENSFGHCGTAIRFDVAATYQDNLTQQ